MPLTVGILCAASTVTVQQIPPQSMLQVVQLTLKLSGQPRAQRVAGLLEHLVSRDSESDQAPCSTHDSFAASLFWPQKQPKYEPMRHE